MCQLWSWRSWRRKKKKKRRRNNAPKVTPLNHEYRNVSFCWYINYRLHLIRSQCVPTLSRRYYYELPISYDTNVSVLYILPECIQVRFLRELREPLCDSISDTSSEIEPFSRVNNAWKMGIFVRYKCPRIWSLCKVIRYWMKSCHTQHM